MDGGTEFDLRALHTGGLVHNGLRGDDLNPFLCYSYEEFLNPVHLASGSMCNGKTGKYRLVH